VNIEERNWKWEENKNYIASSKLVTNLSIEPWSPIGALNAPWGNLPRVFGAGIACLGINGLATFLSNRRLWVYFASSVFPS
jgi:hypothetical protein